VVPHRIIDPEPDEPAEQQVEAHPLHELTLGAHRIERLQEERPQQLLRRDRGPADPGIELVEPRRKPRQGVVYDRPDRPQRMPSGHPGLQIDVAE
jgi:hypothetical protein